MIASRRARMSAANRREEILAAAVREFALKGLHGTSTEVIAAHVGISQPYLFRLYGTKKALFLAAVERGFDRIEAAFRSAALSDPGDPLMAMGRAYRQLLNQPEELLLQLQAYAASSDQEVQAVVRRRFGELYRLVEDLTRAERSRIREFFATGMFLNVVAAIDLGSLVGMEDWVEGCLDPAVPIKSSGRRPGQTNLRRRVQSSD